VTKQVSQKEFVGTAMTEKANPELHCIPTETDPFDSTQRSLIDSLPFSAFVLSSNRASRTFPSCLTRDGRVTVTVVV